MMWQRSSNKKVFPQKAKGLRAIGRIDKRMVLYVAKPATKNCFQSDNERRNWEAMDSRKFTYMQTTRRCDQKAIDTTATKSTRFAELSNEQVDDILLLRQLSRSDFDT